MTKRIFHGFNRAKSGAKFPPPPPRLSKSAGSGLEKMFRKPLTFFHFLVKIPSLRVPLHHLFFVPRRSNCRLISIETPFIRTEKVSAAKSVLCGSSDDRIFKAFLEYRSRAFFRRFVHFLLSVPSIYI